MLDQEIEYFLEQPHILRLAFTDERDNGPAVHPVWYYYKNDKLYVATDRKGIKARSIRKHSRVYFLVDVAGAGPPRGIRGKATAVVVDDKGYAMEVTKRNITRYLGSLEGKAAKEIMEEAVDSCVIEITPMYIATWKY